MAEQLAFDIAKGLVSQLSSPVLEQLSLWWNFKDDLEELKSTISAIKAVLLDAEEKSVTSNLVQDWLAKLKDALYDAEDLLDDVCTEDLRKKLMNGNKLSKEVRVFFSRSNQFAYGLKMGRRIKAIKAGDITCKMHDFMHDLAVLVSGRESRVLDSDPNSSTREVDDKCRHVSVDFSLIPFFKGKKLRTLLYFPKSRAGNMSDATWDSIISNGRCLRVLELDALNLHPVPNSIHKLKHLRYLDLSHNANLKVLPPSICKIQNLQVLKLDWCSNLEELPKKIEQLVNLTHLPCYGCDGLTHMPRGIGKLTSLQTLSMFVVDKNSSHGGAAADLSELSGLNNLRGELKITNLGFVRNAKEEFKASNLKGKQHLQLLILIWGGDNEDEDKSLEDLQPHPNLKKLWVKGWMGDAKFPTWISLLTNLTNMKISGPSKFKHLPSLAPLPHLKVLWISNLTELEYMDDNAPSGEQGEAESFFPSLTVLGPPSMPKSEELVENTR